MSSDVFYVDEETAEVFLSRYDDLKPHPNLPYEKAKKLNIVDQFKEMGIPFPKELADKVKRRSQP